ncbi:MAG: NUDIX hydrolase [Deltaproteobacteria bacterium]|nr:NUDIX hydrolase [Deltaproteobacteria bacterium]MBT4089338.1 NUDIX hydrolase [Deltaproteobacteria bacterium]MBT4264791.1 NUDIX hydrolase [Deltaproteobacteria bacterium]MBT4639253.1 NUDIX hydrolase [Deltaproteobacteria bacterium]MBT6502333.1 NUDIX hydrolase [Deltaproteobacteria bacterium]
MEIKEIKKVTNYHHLNMYEITYLDRFQKQKAWQIASRQPEPRCASGEFNKPDAVVIVPFHIGKNKLVIIEEFRVPLAGYQFGFPAGLVDEDETIQEAAKRELYEETGLNVTTFLRQSPPVYSTSGMSDESVVMVYVECEGEPSSINNEGSEDITTLMVTPTEAAQLCERQDVKIDVKTWLVLNSFVEKEAI